MTNLAAIFAALPPENRRAALEGLSSAELQTLEYHWPLWARPDQLAPIVTVNDAPWRAWLLLAGRGAGKTRAACEYTRAEIEAARRRSIGIVGPTADTLRRDIVSTLLAISPPDAMPTHEPSQRRVVWPNGAVAHLLSSEEPDRIRGLNLDGFQGDELTSWAAPQECWDNLQLALRVSGPKGDAPAGVIATTPKRHALLKAIIADPSTVVTRARTLDNAAHLDPRTLDYLQRRYGGTTLGRQELEGELLEDAEGALWTRSMLDEGRTFVLPELRRVVVGVDPSGSSRATGAETGIVAAGLGRDGHGYIIADASDRHTPDGWARAAVGLFRSIGADRIVAEKNYGGEMVEATIRAVVPNVPVKMVTATRGKAVRAEPIAALYEQRRVHHVGNLPGLEDQLAGWDPAGNDPSPDRMDALVWALTDLMGEKPEAPARRVTLPYMAR